MGKKRQRERRRAQLQRAVGAGDIAELRRRFSNNWRATAGQLEAVLRGAPEPSAELLSLAEDAAAALRRDGAFEVATKLVEAAGPRTTTLRVEAALLAFARGDDEALHASVGAHPDVAAALGALAAVTHGGYPRPAAKGSPVGVKALTGLARMVAAAASRDRTGLTRIAKEIPEEVRPRFFFDVIHAAASLAALGAREKGAGEFARTLGQSSLVRGVAARERALADLLAEAAPATVERKAIVHVAAADVARKRRAEASLHEHRGEGADPMAAAIHAARAVGESAFADPAAGALMVGFSRLVEHDTAGALRSFDVAIAGGADLVEALRGRWMALSAHARRKDRCDPREAAEAAAAAERLAHALKSRPGASPYAVVAAVRSSWMFAAAGDFTGVARAGSFVRECVPAGSLPPALLAELEVHALRKGLTRPDAALQKRLAEITTSMPKLVDAWELRLDVAAQAGISKDELGTLIVEAAEKTGDPELRSEAEAVRRQRAKDLPPSAAAQVVLRTISRIEACRDDVVSPEGQLDPEWQARLSQLPPPARHAVHAALLVELGCAGRWDEVLRFLRPVARQATPAELGELLVVYCFIPADDTETSFARALRALSAAGLAHPVALREALGAVMAMGHEQAAPVVLSILAPHLTSSELHRTQHQVRQMRYMGPQPAVVDRCQHILDHLADALEPGYSLRDAIDGVDDGDEFPGEMLESAEEMLRQLSPGDRAKMMQLAEKAAMGKAPSPAELDQNQADAWCSARQRCEEATMTGVRRYGLGSERVEAFEQLGLDTSADATAIEQAYRRATLAHPPDTDPDGFREVRAAYERLADPWAEVRARLSALTCYAEPPAFAKHEPALRHALALELLRAVVGRIDARLLLAEAPQEKT